MIKDLVVYVINLDRSPERLNNMKVRLSQMGLDFIRISAVDGKKVEFSSKEIDADKYSFAHGKYITSTEVACFISHYNAMNEFLKTSRAKYALILEDDMLFDDGFISLIVELINVGGWDMVKLNGAHSGGNILWKKLDRYSLVLNAFHQSKSGAYIISKDAAKSYVSKMLPMFVPFDHEFVKFWKYGLRGFSVCPFPTREEGGQSTIDYSMVRKNRKIWYKKLPTVFYKSWIAVRRLGWVGFILIKKYLFCNSK